MKNKNKNPVEELGFSDEQIEKIRKELIEYAKYKGFNIVDIYSDEGQDDIVKSIQTLINSGLCSKDIFNLSEIYIENRNSSVIDTSVDFSVMETLRFKVKNLAIKMRTSES